MSRGSENSKRGGWQLAMLCLLFFTNSALGGWCDWAYETFALPWQNFRQEVREQGRIRWVLKNVSPDEKPGWHFLVEYEPPEVKPWYHPLSVAWHFIPHKITRPIYGKPHDLDVLGGILHNVVKRPVRAVTGRLFGQKKDPSAFLMLPTTLIAGFAYGMAQDKAAELGLEESVQLDIEKNAEEWNRRIAGDYAYDDIKRLLEGKNISAKNARQRAYNRFHALNRYHEYVDGNADATALFPESFLDNPLFADIKHVWDNGLSHQKGYKELPGFSTRLSIEQLRELIDLRHTLYANYNLIAMWVNQAPKLTELRKDGHLGAVLQDIESDSFVQELMAAHRKGSLTKEQLIYRLQEDMHWRIKFIEWDVLHVQKQLKVDGEYSDEPLNLEKIQADTREELGSTLGGNPI